MSGDGELPLVRRSGKSESAFRTISEVAEELDVPQHVLRFWESKFPQVRPLKRGGGRRYYRPEDVALLRRIRDLLYSEGYTIKGVQKLLREGGHRDGARDAEPTLPLHDEDAVAQPSEMDDGEPDDIAVEAVAPEPEEAVQSATQNRKISPDVRHELEGILAELEALKGLLQTP